MPNEENNLVKGILYIKFDVEFPIVTFGMSDSEGERVLV